MIRKLFLLNIKNSTRFLSFILVVIILGTFALPVYAEEPEEETTVSEEELFEIEPLAVQDVPAPFADSSEDTNYIFVEKTFSNLPEDLIPDEFQVTVRSDKGDIYTLNEENTVSRTTDAEGNAIWRWKISDADTGTYTVSEAGEAVSGYTVTKSGEGTVEVKAADITVLVPVHETTCSHNNWPVKVEDDSNVLFAATLTQGGVAVISESPLSASQRAAVSQAVLKIKGPWKNPVYFYSIEEQFQNGTGFELNGAAITYDDLNEEVIISQTRNWQHVATLKYSISEANNPEIALNNVYKRSVTDVSVRKTVAGNMGDKKKEFSFTVSVKEDGEDVVFAMNGETYTGSAEFSLKDGESVLLKNIPVGAQLSVAEADYRDERYSTAYTLDNGEAVSGNAVTISDVAEEGHTIIFTNRKDVIPDTGIWLDTLPYFLIICIAVGSTFVLFCCRNKRSNK